MRKRKLPLAWVLATDMGYGHQRAAWSLSLLAKDKNVINASHYPGIPEQDRKIWQASRNLYETISRFKKIPVIGDLVFGIFDKFQEIEEFYPKDQGIEHPTLQLRQIYALMEQKNWGKHLIENLNKNPLPLVTTFSVIAFMAEYWGYKGKIFLIITDTDVSRAWASLNPTKSKIIYCVTTQIAKERLERYQVPKSNIFYTGFPLPLELLRTAKKDLKKRLQVLDPERRYLQLYQDVVKRYLGTIPPKPKRKIPLKLTFAVGGAGAQKEIGEEILMSLAPLLKKNTVKLNLVAGIREDVRDYFKKLLQKKHLSSLLGRQVTIIFEKSIQEYFHTFNHVLCDTDILWTKPSELVFYAALGIPIILAPPIGSQEVHNKKWLLDVGAGIEQLDPKFCHQWLFDFLKEGRFAEATMQGYVEMEKEGTTNIIQLVGKL